MLSEAKSIWTPDEKSVVHGVTTLQKYLDSETLLTERRKNKKGQNKKENSTKHSNEGGCFRLAFLEK